MMPRRLAGGVDPQRLALLLAVLHRHGGAQVGGFDVFINVVGGVRIDEPAADLAILMAVYSSYKNKALEGKLIVFGEVGLAGEIRPVQRGQERIREAVKLGFKKILIPSLNKPKQLAKDIEIIGISRIEEALSLVA
jgi:DNA repair protein RadA/Sms